MMNPHIFVARKLVILVTTLDFRYGDKEWTNSEHCQGIHELECDLSEATSDPREWYYARVRSLSSEGFSSWVLSHRFYPQWESEFNSNFPLEKLTIKHTVYI